MSEVVEIINAQLLRTRTHMILQVSVEMDCPGVHAGTRSAANTAEYDLQNIASYPGSTISSQPMDPKP